MDLRISEVTVASVPTLIVDGIVDLATIGTLHGNVDRAIRRHPGRRIAIDLESVPALDDAALGVLLGLAATARDHGGEVIIVASTPTIRGRLTRTRLDRAIDVVDSISEHA